MNESAAYSAGAVARRLGVAVTTLRTWHQRYGVGPSVHERGQHRRYTDRDIERLEAMQRLIAGGVAPAEAARWVTRGPESRDAPAADSPAPDARTAGSAASSVLGAADSSALGAEDSSALGAADSSALGAADSSAFGAADSSAFGAADSAAFGAAADVRLTVRGLHRAALRLDAPAVRLLVGQAVRRLGVVAAWDNVLRPVLTWIGDRHAATGGLVEVEHLLSTCISAVLGAVPRPAPTVPLRIMLACADEEQHSLPVEALAAALAAAGVPVRQLGARVPTSALLAAVRRTGPIALLVWSHHRSTADPAQLAAVLAERSRPLVVAAGGPGWNRQSVPPGVCVPRSLSEAITELTAYP